MDSKIDQAEAALRTHPASRFPRNQAMAARVGGRCAPEHGTTGWSILTTVPFGMGSTTMANEGSTDMTAEVSVNLLPGSRVHRRQLRILPAILSARKSSMLAGSFQSESGSPR
jgi:hypothetical protein